jgi:hypothetical protein
MTRVIRSKALYMKKSWGLKSKKKKTTQKNPKKKYNKNNEFLKLQWKINQKATIDLNFKS